MSRAAARVVAALCLCSCVATTPSPAAHLAACESDRDCLYGLVCKAAGGAAPRCVWEEFGPCGAKAPCLGGQTCREGVCTVECVVDSECGSGRACRVGACQDGTPGRCLVDADCGPGHDCIGGRCHERLQLRCFSDFDCRPPERCIAGRCR